MHLTDKFKAAETALIPHGFDAEDEDHMEILIDALRKANTQEEVINVAFWVWDKVTKCNQSE
jgi:hypothetical protein